ncbi:MAG: sugar phosphate isomerase/epimerase [Candidatus Brockarchaeota archaeon]|nr:sugar phosphate isomerase/epimerase [Candidatus Brockarchaeota archaeon]
MDNVKPKVGAQLIVWGERAAKDLGGVLDEVASLSYAGVEMGPEPLDKLADPKEPFSSRGLALVGLHIGVGDMKLVDTCIRLLRKCEARYLLFSGAGGRGNTEKEYREGSKFMKSAASRARDFGIKVCYHNHHQEIVDGARGIKIICSEVEPELLTLCVDTFWVQYAGDSPVRFLEENIDRVSYLHLKDLRGKEFVELGQGVVDFPGVFKAIEGREIEWAVVEQDTTKRTPKESMGISRDYLKKLGL